MKNVNNFKQQKFSVRVLPRLCLIFFQFKPSFAYKSVTYKKVCILFVYLAYHFTNVCTKLYIFCISPSQNDYAYIKTTLHKALL